MMIMMERGIDVSVYQGVIDWQKVKKSGISFVYVKFAQGKSDYNLKIDKMFLDSRALDNISGARKAGLKVGIYYYLTAADEQEAYIEINEVLRRIRTHGIHYDMPIAIDCESRWMPLNNGREYTAVVRAAARRLHNATGENVTIYTSSAYRQALENCWNDLSESGWVRWWVSRPGKSYNENDHITQTGTGKIAGIHGLTDINVAMKIPGVRD